MGDAKSNNINLKEFLHEHIRYEIDMLFYSYSKLQEYGRKIDQMNINIFLETFLMHSRNLYEFLCRKTKKFNDDSRAYDFFDKKIEWLNILPTTLTKKQVDSRTGKELAHITYKRISGIRSEKQRDTQQILQELKKIINLFLTKIPKKFDGKTLLKKRPFS